MSHASKLQSNFTLYWQSPVTFSQDDIGKIIQNLNPNKAHSYDDISTWIFKKALSTGLLPSNWEKGDKKSWKTTIQLHYSQYVGKSFKD